MKVGTLCYVRKYGKTLMIHRVKKQQDMHEGKWNGLGGKIKSGESPEECVIREVREESGLILKNPILKGILSFPGFWDNDDWLVFLFVANEFDGQLLDSQEGNLKWIEDSKLLELNLWEGDKIFLKWLDKPSMFSAKFVYGDDGKLKGHDVVFY